MRLGRRVQQHHADADGGDAVDERVVHLGQQRGAVALEAVDHVQLPQRPRAVQPARHLARDVGGELVVGARSAGA